MLRIRYIATNGPAACYGPQTPTLQDEEDSTAYDKAREILSKAFNSDNRSSPVYVNNIALLADGKEHDITGAFQPNPAIDPEAFFAAEVRWRTTGTAQIQPQE